MANELEKYKKKRSYTKLMYSEEIVGRDSVVGIATRYGLERFGDRIPMGATLSVPVQTGPGVHPVSYTSGTGSLVGGGGKAAGGVALTN